MRTIKRISRVINRQKQSVLLVIAKAYAKEKQYWLNIFQKRDNIPYIQDARKLRGKAVKEKYKSQYKLQNRMWKLALQDAADTMHKYWHSLFDIIKKNIFRNQTLSKQQKHYAYWLLYDIKRFQEVLNFSPIEFKELTANERKKVIHYLNRQIRKYKKKLPKVKLMRSFSLDQNCYEIFTHKGKQYIKMMSLIPRQRITVPLLGNTPIRGNIRVVLQKEHAEIHYTAKIKPVKQKNQEVIAVDFGYTEAFTDSDGNQYGKALGNIMTQKSDTINNKMQKRHKLHALQKKYQASTDPSKKKKARNIKQYNLGHSKLNSKQEKAKTTLTREINTASNQMFNKKFGILVSEDLSNTFRFNHSRNWNRRLSSWVRGILTERISFKALVKGFDHKQVNPAYCSQTCIVCDYVGRENRKQDKFQCLHCGYVGHSDEVAAINLKRRHSDRDHTVYAIP